RRRAERLARTALSRQLRDDLIRAGRRRWRRGVGDLLERRRGERQLIAADYRAARIGDLDVDRQAGESGLPVGRARDDAEVRRLPRAIDAAVREQVRGQLLPGPRVLDAAGVEPREVQ